MERINKKFDYEFVVEEYHSDNLIYSIQSISKKYKEIDLDDVKSASLTIEANDHLLNHIGRSLATSVPDTPIATPISAF